MRAPCWALGCPPARRRQEERLRCSEACCGLRGWRCTRCRGPPRPSCRRRITKQYCHQLHAWDVFLARTLAKLAKVTGPAGVEFGSRLGEWWRALELKLLDFGSSIRQSPIKSASSCIALMLAVEACYCVLTVPMVDHGAHGAHDAGHGAAAHDAHGHEEAALHHRALQLLGAAVDMGARLGRRALNAAHGADAHGEHGEHEHGHDAGFCAAEAGHHLINLVLEITSAIISGASSARRPHP